MSCLDYCNINMHLLYVLVKQQYCLVISSSNEFIFTITAEPSSVSKLSEEEKILLVDSWKQLEQDADKIGTVTFMK